MADGAYDNKDLDPFMDDIKKDLVELDLKEPIVDMTTKGIRKILEGVIKGMLDKMDKKGDKKLTWE